MDDYGMAQPPWRNFRRDGPPDDGERPRKVSRLRRVQGIPTGAAYRSTTGRPSRFAYLQ